MPDQFDDDPTAIAEFRLGVRLTEIAAELDQQSELLQVEYVANPRARSGPDSLAGEVVAVVTLQTMVRMLIEVDDLDRRSLAASAINVWDGLSAQLAESAQLQQEQNRSTYHWSQVDREATRSTPCPGCGAEAGSSCVTSDGRLKQKSDMHAARWRAASGDGRHWAGR